MFGIISCLKCMAWEDNSRRKEKSLSKGQPYLSFSVMETAFSISLIISSSMRGVFFAGIYMEIE